MNENNATHTPPLFAHDDANTGHEHNHDHEHGHGHDHDHDHQHGHTPEQEHEHEPSAEPGHDQEDDHDHGQARDEQALAERISKEDWELLSKRLLNYAAYSLSRYGALARRFCSSAEDYVQRAVILVLTGKRNFPVSTTVSTFGFLCGVVDSLVSHDAEKAGRRKMDLTIGSDDGEDAPADQISEDRLPSATDFEAEIVYWDGVESFARIVGPRLGAYVRLIALDEFSTAQEYADALGTTVANIRNMDKQLKRRKDLYEDCNRGTALCSRSYRNQPLRMAGAWR